MKAFVDRLCEHVVIVRSGLEAGEHGDPYEFAVAAKEEDGKAFVVALVAPRPVVWWLRWIFPPRLFTLRHAFAMTRALKDIGLKPIWDGLTRKTWKKKP